METAGRKLYKHVFGSMEMRMSEEVLRYVQALESLGADPRHRAQAFIDFQGYLIRAVDDKALHNGTGASWCYRCQSTRPRGFQGQPRQEA
eukprot:431184-Lingulodinium_polyedra.AAC.1